MLATGKNVPCLYGRIQWQQLLVDAVCGPRREFDAEQHRRYLEAVQAQDAHRSVGETGSPAKPMIDSAQVVEAGGSEPQRHKTHELPHEEPHEERPHEMRGVEVPVEMPADDVQRQPPEELSVSPFGSSSALLVHGYACMETKLGI
ncbi:hypothetical protein OOU_Y34scaffold00887g16 [Pyricularia oryzae Y34]|uniref:Uncharacterized protein n=2 Tax=Pyricularia oryzae TaxID=318829 RepID=A0AA97PGI1_PYRO3|nr:hypothetical protein OOU_Y34scaffold00887g16 [Pyricularia oryzae Y34]